MKEKIFGFIFFVAVFTALLIGCNKKKDVLNNNPASSSIDTSLTSSRSEIYAESFYDDACTMGEQLSNGSWSLFRHLQNSNPLCGCSTITYDTLHHWNSVVANFGAVFCLNSDGRNRRGAVIIRWPPHTHYRDSGNVDSITFVHYLVDNNSVDGTILITNMGHISGVRTWQISVNGTIILANNGDTLSWTSNRVRKLLSGEIQNNGDVDWSIAKIGISGTANGRYSNGISFTSSITSDLIRDFSCIGYYRFYSSGKIDFAPANKPVHHIDFGNGNCDDTAKITIGTYLTNFRMI